MSRRTHPLRWTPFERPCWQYLQTNSIWAFSGPPPPHTQVLTNAGGSKVTFVKTYEFIVMTSSAQKHFEGFKQLAQVPADTRSSSVKTGNDSDQFHSTVLTVCPKTPVNYCRQTLPTLGGEVFVQSTRPQPKMDRYIPIARDTITCGDVCSNDWILLIFHKPDRTHWKLS